MIMGISIRFKRYPLHRIGSNWNLQAKDAARLRTDILTIIIIIILHLPNFISGRKKQLNLSEIFPQTYLLRSLEPSHCIITWWRAHHSYLHAAKGDHMPRDGEQGRRLDFKNGCITIESVLIHAELLFPSMFDFLSDVWLIVFDV